MQAPRQRNFSLAKCSDKKNRIDARQLLEPVEVVICGADVRARAHKCVGHTCRVDIHRGVLGKVQRLWEAHTEGTGVAETGRAAVNHELERKAVDHLSNG